MTDDPFYIGVYMEWAWRWLVLCLLWGIKRRLSTPRFPNNFFSEKP
jgi:hypothetical protein